MEQFKPHFWHKMATLPCSVACLWRNRNAPSSHISCCVLPLGGRSAADAACEAAMHGALWSKTHHTTMREVTQPKAAGSGHRIQL